MLLPALLLLVLTVSCDSLVGGDDEAAGDEWDGGRIPLGTDVDYRISAGNGAYEIHSFTTDGAGDYRITVSDFSSEASLLWYLFASKEDAENYLQDTDLPDLVIADGNIVDENPQTALAAGLSGETTYYLGIEDFSGNGSDYRVNVSAAD
jgi:hypothetical protein